MNERTQQQLADYFDGTITPEEHASLLEAVRGDSSVSCEFARQLRLHRYIRFVVSERGGEQEAFLERMAQSLPKNHLVDKPLMGPLTRDEGPGEGKRWVGRPPWFSLPYLLAACLMILASGYFLFFSRGPAQIVATLAAQPGVIVERNRTVIDVKKEGSLQAGDSIRVPAGHKAVIRYADATQVEIGADSHVTFQPDGNGIDKGKLIQLRQGTLTADVAQQPQGNPMIFEIANARATVLGTKLQLLKDDHKAVLTVTKGSVEFTRLADAKSVIVQAGFVAEVGDGVVLEPRVIEEATPGAANIGVLPSQNPPETIVFLNEFDTILPDEWTPNDLVRLKEAAGEVTAIVSSPYRSPNPTWNPDVEVTLSSLDADGTTALYRIPGNMEIRIRIKSEKSGQWGFSQVPTNLRFLKEHFYSGRFDVDTEWKEFVIHSDEVRPYRTEGPSRDFLPGVEIQRFTIYGFGTGKLFVDRLAVVSPVKSLDNPEKETP